MVSSKFSMVTLQILFRDIFHLCIPNLLPTRALHQFRVFPDPFLRDSFHLFIQNLLARSNFFRQFHLNFYFYPSFFQMFLSLFWMIPLQILFKYPFQRSILNLLSHLVYPIQFTFFLDGFIRILDLCSSDPVLIPILSELYMSAFQIHRFIPTLLSQSSSSSSYSKSLCRVPTFSYGSIPGQIIVKVSLLFMSQEVEKQKERQLNNFICVT